MKEEVDPQTLSSAAQLLRALEALRPHLPAAEAVDRGLTLLPGLLKHLERAPLLPGDQPEAAAVAAARRTGRAVLMLLRAASPWMRQPAWRNLLLYKRVLSDLFGAARAPGVMPCPLGTLSAPPTGEPVAPLVLATAPLEAVPRLAPLIEGLPSEDRMLAVVAWLAEPVVISPTQAAGRDFLIRHPAWLEADRLPLRHAVRIASAWMFCSYADHPDRHQVKRALNRSIVRGLYNAGLQPPAPRVRPGERRSRGERPVLLVMAERFRKQHAMYRCYAPSIAQLRRDYHVVILGQRTHLDEGAAELADEVWEVPSGPDGLPALVQRIVQAAPDAIFYPSVGMSFWAIALANLRLAPMQFMSIGHPASSFSAQMDCMVLGRDVLGDPACFTETLVVRDAPGNPIHPPSEPWGPPPEPRVTPDRLEIAVPAMAAKIAPAFVTLCARLAREAGRPVRFHFFPNRPGLGTRHLEAALRQAFATAVSDGVSLACVVRHPAHYTQYMAWLAECDFALATFPFGNANSTVDCLLLGKPVVALEGDEPAARTDRRMLRLAGAPAWLLNTTREGYFEAALRLARDDALRVETARAILAANPSEALFERERAEHPDDFAEVVTWMLDNVDLIRRGAQDGSRKVWWPEDRRATAQRE